MGENIVQPSVSVAKIVDADGAKNPNGPVIDLIERFIGLMGIFPNILNESKKMPLQPCYYFGQVLNITETDDK